MSGMMRQLSHEELEATNDRKRAETAESKAASYKRDLDRTLLRNIELEGENRVLRTQAQEAEKLRNRLQTLEASLRSLGMRV